nr:THAP domain-containing protein 1-like [Helicoverpa armigera]
MRSCVYCKRRYKKDSHISFHRLPKDLEEKKVWLQNMKTHNWTPKTYNYLCSLHFNDECFVKHFNRTALKPGSIPTIFEGTSTFASSPHPSMTTSSPRPSTSISSPRSTASISSPRSTASRSLPSPLTTKSATKSANIHTSSAKRKLLCDANILELSDQSKRDQEQLTYHDYKVSSTPKKARIKVGLLHDHCYEITSKSLKTVAQQTRRSLKFAKIKAKTLSQRVRRLELKITNLKSVINDLI